MSVQTGGYQNGSKLRVADSNGNIEKNNLQNNKGRSPVSPLFESFEECKAEVITDIKGAIPSWLSGSLVRVGPGKFEFGDDQMKHWFDGHGIVHRFTLADGKVTFQSRYVESEAYKANTVNQRVTVTEFGTQATPDPCMSRFARFKSHFFGEFKRTDNANVNVFKHGDALIVNTDSPVMQTVTTGLDTIGTSNIQDALSVHTMTSHPHFGDDGSMYVSASSYQGRPTYHIVRVPPPSEDLTDTASLLKQAHSVASIPAKSALNPTYCHSFGMTENYFIFCETPITMNLMKTVGKIIFNTPINDVFNYDPSAMALFHVIDRRTGERFPIQYQIQGIFFWHMINCYEDDDHIVMDMCSFYDFNNTDLFTELLEEFRNGLFIEEKKWAAYKHHPMRLVLPLRPQSNSAGEGDNLVMLSDTKCTARWAAENLITLESERLLPEGQDRIDMPQINYDKYNGRKYKYFYGTGLFVNQHFMNALGKVDVETKSCLRWFGTVDQYPSEPVFIAHPDAETEDHGVILSSVCDTHPDERDFLLILDAQTFEEIGRAYVPADVCVPYSFHGSYFKQ